MRLKIVIFEVVLFFVVFVGLMMVVKDDSIEFRIFRLFCFLKESKIGKMRVVVGFLFFDGE